MSNTTLVEREAKEVDFAIEYVARFNHGTSGHLAYTTIAKLAHRVAALEAAGENILNNTSSHGVYDVTALSDALMEMHHLLVEDK